MKIDYSFVANGQMNSDRYDRVLDSGLQPTVIGDSRTADCMIPFSFVH